MKTITSMLTAAALLITPALNCAMAATDNTTTSKHASVNRINLNKASAQQLVDLKGLGMKKAQAIVDYRKTNGPFKAISELTNVKGIGDKFVEKNAQFLSL